MPTYVETFDASITSLLLAMVVILSVCHTPMKNTMGEWQRNHLGTGTPWHGYTHRNQKFFPWSVDVLLDGVTPWLSWCILRDGCQKYCATLMGTYIFAMQGDMKSNAHAI